MGNQCCTFIARKASETNEDNAVVRKAAVKDKLSKILVFSQKD